MQLDERLQCVQRNRQRTARSVRLGPLVQRLIKQAYAPELLAPTSHTADLLAGVVDEEFRNHCRIASVAHQTLVLHVDKQGMVFALRARWTTPIEKALDHLRGRAAIRRVVFQIGVEGWRINPAKGA